jgi:hypothetical protein
MIRIMSRSVRAPVITLSATALGYRISSASMMGHTSTLPIHCAMADVLAFRFNQAGRLIAAPAYIANAQLNEFYTRRIGSLIRGRTSVADVHTLFGHPQATSRRPDGFVYYYTLDVFNPFEQLGSGRH